MRHIGIMFVMFTTIAVCCTAQTLSVFAVDTTNFPRMSARYYAFDQNGVVLRPAAGEFSITENGVQRTVLSSECQSSPPLALSSVLVIDVSGSMNTGVGAESNLELAKAAARVWVTNLNLGQSECAITSFDSKNYLNSDFTTSRPRLLTAINTLIPQGGTDYDAAFITPMAGGLLISQNGKKRRAIVFLTDGIAPTPRTKDIINEAKKQSCAVYCITLGMIAPPSLKEIATKTGGLVFENITSIRQIEDVYRQILMLLQGSDACTLQWTSGNVCNTNTANLTVQWKTARATAQFTPPKKAFIQVVPSPSFVYFNKLNPGSRADTVITITARNSDITIFDIKPQNTTTVFSVVNTTFPLRINRNTSKTITIRCTPTDSIITYCNFNIITNSCIATMSASCGFAGRRMDKPTLMISQPNGGETYVVGAAMPLSWTGLAESDTVDIDLSRDNGKTWSPIVSRTPGLQTTWNAVTRPTSTQCRVRIRQFTAGISSLSDSVSSFKPLGSYPVKVKWNPDGVRLVTTSDSMVRIWDALNSSLVRSFRNTESVRDVAWSPDGSEIVCIGVDDRIRIYSATLGTVSRFMLGTSSNMMRVGWSPDGTRIFTYDTTERNIRFWNSATGQSMGVYPLNTAIPYDCSWSPDGALLAVSCSDNQIYIIDVVAMTLSQTITGGRNYFPIAWSPLGDKIAFYGGGKLWMWDKASNTTIQSPEQLPSTCLSLEWNPEASQVLVAGSNGLVYFIEKQSLVTERTLNTYGLSISYNPLYPKVATVSGENKVYLWIANAPLLQEDISDFPFDIVVPAPLARDVDVGLCLIGATKDTTLYDAVRNVGNYDFRVDTVFFRGQDSAAFAVVSGAPPYVLKAGLEQEVEYRFVPVREGLHSAQMVVVTQSDTLVQRIQGAGVPPKLALTGVLLDCDSIDIGKDTVLRRAATIRNISTTPVAINRISTGGPNTTDFSLISPATSFVLKPGDTAYVDVRFRPTAPGRTTSQLFYEYSGVGSPATVQLFGVGISRGAEVTASAAPRTMVCESTIIDSAIILNTGTDTLRVSRTELRGQNQTDFTYTGVSTFVLAPSASRVLTYRCTPSASGVRSAELYVVNNSVNDSALAIALSIRKDDVRLKPSTDTLDIGMVCPSASIDTSIVMTNIGTLRTGFRITATGGAVAIGDTALAPQEQSSVRVRFSAPSSDGIVQTTVIVTDTICQRETYILIRARVVAPQLTASSVVNFGTVAIGNQRTFTFPIVNTTARPLTLDSLLGVTTPFILISTSPALPATLGTNDTLVATLRYSAQTEGDATGTLRLVSNTPCPHAQSITLRGSGTTGRQPSITSVINIDFDTVCVGIRKSKFIEIRNNGTEEVTLDAANWRDGSTGTIFSLTGFSPRRLAVDSIAQYQLEFVPTSAQISTNSIEWQATGVSTNTLATTITSISGKGVICGAPLRDTVQATVAISDGVARAGEDVTFAVWMKDKKKFDVVGAPRAFTASIRVNPTVLRFHDATLVCRDETPTECTIDVRGERATSDTLLLLRGRAMLGTTDYAPVELTTFTWLDTTLPAVMQRQHGSIRIDGICSEGGIRLYMPGTVRQTMASHPNPASNILTIEYGMAESVPITIVLLNTSGQVVLTPIVNEQRAAGYYRQDIDVSTLSSGVYMLRLSAPNTTLRTRVDIVR